jgi:hypothetical protein
LRWVSACLISMRYFTAGSGSQGDYQYISTGTSNDGGSESTSVNLRLLTMLLLLGACSPDAEVRRQLSWVRGMQAEVFLHCAP